MNLPVHFLGNQMVMDVVWGNCDVGMVWSMVGGGGKCHCIEVADT